MATLQDIANAFAKDNANENPEKVAQNWEQLSDQINNASANSGRGYKPRTIVNFTTKVRKALLQAGAKESVVTQIESRKGLRSVTRASDEKARARYTSGDEKVSIRDASKLINEAVAVCENSVYIGDLIAALGILTGRRCAKIAQLSAKYEFRVIDSKHIEFYNLLKGGLSVAAVPVLGSIESVVAGINTLNQLLPDDVESMNPEQIKRRYQSNASKSAKKFLKEHVEGGKLTMHTTRKIYTAICIESVYGNSDLLPASRSAFITHILGHTSKNFDENYDFIQIEKNYEW